ncbi:suppressor of fused domain protein [Kitasatospora sp. NPDC001540]|uniref:suppressor of fused domain protein n=1 Tax=Kitasatospora sp. NPDC001540 TaxID=3364014 RepID=UPI0036803391
MSTLVEHLESRLGRTSGGWPPPARSPPGAPMVAHFADGRLPGVRSFATVGLSRTPLWDAPSGRHLHLELLVCEYERHTGDAGFFPEVLEYVAGRLFAHGAAVLRGEVLPLPVPLPGGTMTGLYAALPVYFDDGFRSVTVENGSEVGVVWLLPVSDREAAFVAERGWRAFEDELARRDPDLLDPSRPSLEL